MSAHLIFFGPSTAGKTALMLGLARSEGEYRFNIDRTWTTRPRRPNEGDTENVFATPEEFEKKRPDFLFPFQTFPAYEYGIEVPEPLSAREVRMRILMPVFAKRFRSLVEAPTVFCSIAPFQENPERVLAERDPSMNPEDLQARLQRFHSDRHEAKSCADIHFQNRLGLSDAVSSLRSVVLHHLGELNLIN